MEPRVARDPDALRAEVIDVSAPTLERCEMEARPLPDRDLGRSDVHADPGLTVRYILLDDCRFGPLAER